MRQDIMLARQVPTKMKGQEPKPYAAVDVDEPGQGDPAPPDPPRQPPRPLTPNPPIPEIPTHNT